jgi:hypothetical protein
MKPYIERTREAVRKIYNAIEAAGLSEKVAFGLVAYRSSTRKTPKILYEARVLSDLRDDVNANSSNTRWHGLRKPMSQRILLMKMLLPG